MLARYSSSAAAAKHTGEFDFIIVGAGSAGCILADRLSANSQNKARFFVFCPVRQSATWMHHLEHDAPGATRWSQCWHALQVLLLEAGKNDRYLPIHIPIGYLYTMNNPRTCWQVPRVPGPLPRKAACSCAHPLLA